MIIIFLLSTPQMKIFRKPKLSNWISGSSVLFDGWLYLQIPSFLGFLNYRQVQANFPLKTSSFTKVLTVWLTSRRHQDETRGAFFPYQHNHHLPSQHPTNDTFVQSAMTTTYKLNATHNFQTPPPPTHHATAKYFGCIISV